jgi:hypothetical protein
MKLNTYIILLWSIFLCTINAAAQASSHSTIQDITNISKIHSTIALKAYQTKGMDKIKDLYYMLAKWSTEQDTAVRQAYKENIHALLLQDNTFIYDVRTKQLKKISEILSNAATIMDVVLKNEKISKTTEDYWIVQYTIISSGTTTTTTVEQKVFLKNSNKQFGATTKKVWQLSLGDTVIVEK